MTPEGKAANIHTAGANETQVAKATIALQRRAIRTKYEFKSPTSVGKQNTVRIQRGAKRQAQEYVAETTASSGQMGKHGHESLTSGRPQD